MPPRLPSVALALLGCAAPAAAQSLDEIREAIRDAILASRIPAFLSTLAGMAEESELSGGRMRVTDGSPDASLRTLSLPLRYDIPLGEGQPDLRVEATVGYASIRFDFPDIWEGQLAGLETRVTTRWSTVGGDLGIGPSLDLGRGVRLQPLAHIGVSYLDNKVIYRGPGAAVTESITDGILFHWDGIYASYGGSLAVRTGNIPLGPVDSHMHLRYDLRYTEGVHVDDPAQDVDATTQWVTTRWDFEGPTGYSPDKGDLRWLANVGYKRFVGGNSDVIGFDGFMQFGAGLRWIAPEHLPMGNEIVVNGSVFVGDDVFGWNVTASLRF